MDRRHDHASTDKAVRQRGAAASPAGRSIWRDLHGSGLTDEYIAAAGCFRSLTDPAAVSRALGWTRPAKDLGPCLAIAFRDAEGKPTSYYRMKPDRPRVRDEKQVKYESPRGQGNRAFFPTHTRPALADAATSVILTEGEKKACKADQEGLPCVGLVGVWGWMRKRKSKDAERELIPDLEAVAWEGRTAFICFDSDLAEKREVAFAEWRLSQALAAKGAAAGRWSGSPAARTARKSA